MGKRKNGAIFKIVFFVIVCVILLFPIAYMLLNSFRALDEVTAIYNQNESIMDLLLPSKFSFESWYQLCIGQPQYLLKFWRSLILCVLIGFGQVVVSVLGGFAFAKYHFKMKSFIYYILVVIMIMPIQVTLVPNYIVLDWLHLTGTWWALLLPAVFSSFGTVLLTQIFGGINGEILEAGKIDGASTKRLLTCIMVPACKGGIISVFLLTFIDAWNMVEQPIVFLKDTVDYPLSVFLASVHESNYALSFACGILVLLPVLLLFLYFNKELVEGIEYLGIK